MQRTRVKRALCIRERLFLDIAARRGFERDAELGMGARLGSHEDPRALPLVFRRRQREEVFLESPVHEWPTA